MGGQVAWTVRLSNGNEYRMEYWTNIVPSLILDEKFFKEDFHHMDEVLNNDSVGADFGLMPTEYGIIVTDFVTKTIISCNGYTSFNPIPLTSRYYYKEKQQFIQSLLDKKFPIKVLCDLNTSDSAKIYPHSIDLRAFLKLTSKKYNDDYCFFYIDNIYGWTIKEFYYFNSHRREAYESIVDLGFKLTDNETANFEKWIEEA